MLLFSCTLNSEYWSRVTGARAEKNAFFEGPNSPLQAEQRSNFAGLDYYPPDESYHFLLKMDILPRSDTVVLPTSTGIGRLFTRYARITLKLSVPQTLVIYKSTEDDGHLFLPFKDKTNGIATYGAGRYLDPVLLKTGEVVIDFNLAYNPYCAYNDDYDCPYPPLENHMNVEIEAGEKIFKK